MFGTRSDSSDSSNKKTTGEVKCSRTNFTEYCDRSHAIVSKEVGVKNEQEFDQEKELSRRPFKDESFSSSSDSPSGDEYNVYYYDPKTVANNSNSSSKYAKNSTVSTTTSASTILANLKKAEDPWDILFARAEGLYAHGHTREACILGVQLAEELLANPPDLMIEGPPMVLKGKRKKVIYKHKLHVKLMRCNVVPKLTRYVNIGIIATCKSRISSINVSCVSYFSEMWISLYGSCGESRIS